MLNLPKTRIVDIDGCVLFHYQDMSCQHLNKPILLPGVLDNFKQWERNGDFILLTTGRKPSTRKATIKQLNELGLFWNEIVFGLPRGSRIIVNDFKPNSTEPTALAVCLE